jgi:hypothetical protein
MRSGWLVCVVALCGCGADQPPYDRSQLSFFVTSVAAGTGGNIGGLVGADAHCQRLAAAVGSKRTWRAYLSAADGSGQPVHARNRIGDGPWTNANGEPVAKSLDDLHGSPGPPQQALSYHENGKRVGLPHDIMTGSNLDGTLAEGDLTCRNWTSTAGKTMLGHSNRIGSCCGNRNTSWNSAHESQGCSSGGLASMGGASYFYCFAID